MTVKELRDKLSGIADVETSINDAVIAKFAAQGSRRNSSALVVAARRINLKRNRAAGSPLLPCYYGISNWRTP